MNMAKNRHLPRIFNRMVFRLWMIMMSLVLLSVAFIWVVQIFLFERNYADAAAAETQNRLKPIMESLYTEDVASDPHFLSNMSRIAGGELMLVNGAGAVSYTHLTLPTIA